MKSEVEQVEKSFIVTKEMTLSNVSRCVPQFL